MTVPAPFDPLDEEAGSRAIAEARAQAATGQLIPLADMARWLDSWGKTDEPPPLSGSSFCSRSHDQI
jgi:predicted transcriptional regulator